MMSLSTVPGVLLPDPILGNPFENPWDYPDLFPATTSPQSQSPKPVGSSSGSDGPPEPKPAGSNSDERKKRRMISNRESARRSRMRKQKHLENLRNQVTRLRVENRELTNRLRYVLYHCHGVKSENHRLRSEHTVLRLRLNRIQEIMMLRQLQQFTSAWPCNSDNKDHCSNNNLIKSTSMMTSNEPIPTPPPSLIAS